MSPPTVARLARAPASSANLGPGFDSLAVALDLYVHVAVSDAPRLMVTSSGEGAELSTDATHLAARVASAVAGHDRLRIHVESAIPVSRGLGSSAALAVAAAAAAGAPDPLVWGIEVDGHPENAAASCLGGLVAAAIADRGAVARRLPLDPALRYVVVIPDRSLATSAAREALPAAVAHRDAAFNLGRLGLLVAGLADHRLLVPEATEDRLHQEPRTTLFPESVAILDGLRRAGALGACWSGAGPSLLAITLSDDAEHLCEVARASMMDSGVQGSVRVLRADVDGVTVTPLEAH